MREGGRYTSPKGEKLNSFATFSLFRCSLFIDAEKIDDNVRLHLCLDEDSMEDMRVNIRPYDDLPSAVENLSKTERKIWVSFVLFHYRLLRFGKIHKTFKHD